MFTFEQLNNYAELNPQDNEINKLCFESAKEYVYRFCSITEEDELPFELKECLIHIFMFKKRKMIASLNNEPFDSELPKDIMDVLYHYMIQNGARIELQGYDKSTLFPLYYCRRNDFNNIEDYYHLKDGTS